MAEDENTYTVEEVVSELLTARQTETIVVEDEFGTTALITDIEVGPTGIVTMTINKTMEDD